MQLLPILQNDAWLAPFAKTITARHDAAVAKLHQLSIPAGSLYDFANAHQYFGLHRTASGWTFREWAPNATAIALVGDFSQWQVRDGYHLRPCGDGVWELTLPAEALRHGELYKMVVYWDGGSGERIPAYATRVVQDDKTALFAAQVWSPDRPYRWKTDNFVAAEGPLLIYECHVGMAQERQGIGTYAEFTANILPRIAAAGYNAIQVMAIQEHPYYGSFGYHVSNFFAPSSRFGTPEELKELVDTAHSMGIAVIMDLVHSHAVKNEAEGLARLDGSYSQYFHGGARREHPAWDSLCFDYGKDEVLHFLLSNCKYWLEEFRFDGFRFDGVTSMLYYNHGLGQAFSRYEDYFDGGQDPDAIIYLSLANALVHRVNPKAITIAEEMSGMPGLAVPFADGGIGFDYRMAMGIPDYWIKLLKESKDEDWRPGSIYWELTNRRADEKTVSYVESHDQALVGDKTVIFRLIDKEMYWHMSIDDQDLTVARGIALHKMIRLVTLATINGGYLNFMGNEFGHPEWIDFPREGNGWSYKYARRQWSLVDNPALKYQFLNLFDRAIICLVSSTPGFQKLPLAKLCDNDADQVLAFSRGELLFVFNFNPAKSFTGYGILAPAGSYSVILSTDNPLYGGFGNVAETVVHFTQPDPLYASSGLEWLKLYLPARSAQVLRLDKPKKLPKKSQKRPVKEKSSKPDKNNPLKAGNNGSSF